MPEEKLLSVELLFTSYKEYVEEMVKGYADELIMIHQSQDRYIDFPTERTSLFIFLKLKKQLFEDGFRYLQVNAIQEPLFKQVHDLALESIGMVETMKPHASLEYIFDTYMIKIMRIRERLFGRLIENIRLYFIDATFDIIDEIVQLRRLLIKDGYELLSVDQNMMLLMEVVYTEVKSKLEKKYKYDKLFVFGGFSVVVLMYIILFVIL